MCACAEKLPITTIVTLTSLIDPALAHLPGQGPDRNHDQGPDRVHDGAAMDTTRKVDDHDHDHDHDHDRIVHLRTNDENNNRNNYL
jgi:ABC-type Zn2+ transport system substrate-binding protein/surface adhesin